MDGDLVVEADVVASEIEQLEGKRFERVRIATREGVAVAFYRRVDVASSGDASLLAVLLDEVSPGRWDALNASEVAVGGSRRISMSPSEGRGDWVVAFYGSAPVGAEVAVIEYEGVHRVPVEDGVYGFMLRAVSEPAILRGVNEPDPTWLRPRFE